MCLLSKHNLKLMQEKRKKKKNSITLTKHFTKFSAILDNTLTNLTNFTKKMLQKNNSIRGVFPSFKNKYYFFLFYFMHFAKIVNFLPKFAFVNYKLL